MEGREKADIMLAGGERGVWDANGASTGGDRGDGNRSSSSLSLKPVLKAMVEGLLNVIGRTGKK